MAPCPTVHVVALEDTDDASGDNYWGYSSLSFFAPDRRYAADRSPGGPTGELRAMVEAFHAEGLKVRPACSFARALFARRPDWRALLDVP